MKASDIPSKVGVPFAAEATPPYINDIPVDPAGGGHAFFRGGFPEENFLPVGAGGIPPWGSDFNGLMKQVTQWTRWQGAGAVVKYDADFATAVGGYPIGAVVAASTLGAYWLSTADDNVTVPGDSGATWTYFTTPQTLLTFHKLTVASNGSPFAVPANAARLRVRMVAGGGGGGATGSSGATLAVNGSTTSFGTNTTGGGARGNRNTGSTIGLGGNGGSSGVTAFGTEILRTQGQGGLPGTQAVLNVAIGGSGGGNGFSPGPVGAYGPGYPLAAPGVGGYGVGVSSSSTIGAAGGGGGGEYVEFVVDGPDASYNFTVGAGGAGGSAGAGGNDGLDGRDGVILIEVIYK